jgi:hypothetical protein
MSAHRNRPVRARSQKTGRMAQPGPVFTGSIARRRTERFSLPERQIAAQNSEPVRRKSIRHRDQLRRPAIGARAVRDRKPRLCRALRLMEKSPYSVLRNRRNSQ